MALELSELKMHVRSVAYSGFGDRCEVGMGVGVGPAVCPRPEYLGWPLGQGFRSMRKDPQKDQLNSI